MEQKKCGRPPKPVQADTTGQAVEQAVKTKMKPRGGNSPVIGDNGIVTQEGDNSKYAALLLEVHSWGKVDKSDVSALEERFIKYLNFCLSHDVKIGNQMCYLALGITKDNAYDWENGRGQGKPHSDFIKNVRAICSGNRELLLQDGKVNPILGIFWQKNYDGMKDVQDIVVTPNNPLGEVQDPATIQQKYLEGTADD